MLIDFPDFETYLLNRGRKGLLIKGKKFLDDHLIKHIHAFSGTEWDVYIVPESEDIPGYTVRIKVDEGRVVNHDCNCAGYRIMPLCKHIVASLYAIRAKDLYHPEIGDYEQEEEEEEMEEEEAPKNDQTETKEEQEEQENKINEEMQKKEEKAQKEVQNKAKQTDEQAKPDKGLVRAQHAYEKEKKNWQKEKERLQMELEKIKDETETSSRAQEAKPKEEKEVSEKMIEENVFSQTIEKGDLTKLKDLVSFALKELKNRGESINDFIQTLQGDDKKVGNKGKGKKTQEKGDSAKKTTGKGQGSSKKKSVEKENPENKEKEGEERYGLRNRKKVKS